MDTIGTATYSPEDNKLRLYPDFRLDKDDYETFKAAGFRWAPKQELFVAPMWTPNREDLLIEFCGEVGDEDTSLVGRAEERADRFDGYSVKRLADAEGARAAVSAIADNIPLGQPILVGHHSERHARRDAEKIKNGMRRAVKMWETSKYWTARAAGALVHADYKSEPTVRARRIKKIEAAERKDAKASQQVADFSHLWRKITDDATDPKNAKRAESVANFDHVHKCFTLQEYPRGSDASPYEGMMSLWSAIDDRDGREPIITPQQARDIALRVHAKGTAQRERWAAHYAHRISYEKALLKADGASHLLDKPKRPKLPPILNYRAERLDWPSRYRHGEMDGGEQMEMTRKQYSGIDTEYKGTRLVDESHRVRVATSNAVRCATGQDYGPQYMGGLFPVFLTGSKTHPRPEVESEEAKAAKAAKKAAQLAAIDKADAEKAEKRDPPPQWPIGPETESDAEPFEALKGALKNGVRVVTADQLFPTPPDLAAFVIETADLQPGQRILEPSAGIGALLEAAYKVVGGFNYPHARFVAVEKNPGVFKALEVKTAARWEVGGEVILHNLDFLAFDVDLHLVGDGFDRIIMNPPFKNGADIKHIQRARKMLARNGRLVAICANGPRQRTALEADASQWIDCEPGSFKASGTNVNAAVVVFDEEDIRPRNVWRIYESKATS